MIKKCTVICWICGCMFYAPVHASMHIRNKPSNNRGKLIRNRLGIMWNRTINQSVLAGQWIDSADTYVLLYVFVVTLLLRLLTNNQCASILMDVRSINYLKHVLRTATSDAFVHVGPQSIFNNLYALCNAGQIWAKDNYKMVVICYGDYWCL